MRKKTAFLAKEMASRFKGFVQLVKVLIFFCEQTEKNKNKGKPDIHNTFETAASYVNPEKLKTLPSTIIK